MALRFSPSRGAGAFALSSAIRGPTGAAATIAVGTTTTLVEAAAATVSNSGSSSAATFNFGIPRGATPAVVFDFDTSTADADPGDGDVRFNHATPASVTTIYFDNADRDGNTITTWLDSFDDSTTTAKGTLVFTPSATPSAKLIYNVTGSVVDGTGYRKVTVAHVAGTTLPSADAYLAVTFSRTGDRGTNPGFRQTYSSTTADADPGAGIFRLNNATIASATAAYLDNVDFSGSTVSGVMDLWDDSTNAVKGSIWFINQDDPAIWATFNVTGSVVDGTGYRKLTLASGQAAGSFAGVFAITFYRTGDIGPGDFSSNTTTSIDNEVVLFSGTAGKMGKRATLTATVVKSAAGVLSAATAGTDFLDKATTSLLTVGYTQTSFAAGTFSSGTYTPSAANGGFQHAVNAGAHTLAPPAATSSLVVEYLNNATAGAITTTGFTKVYGAFTTTDTQKFLCNIIKTNGYSLLQITPLQ